MLMIVKPQLDFTKVEALRKHMLLTKGTMAGLLGVSRVTYYDWLAGKHLIRSKHDERVRMMLRRLLAIIQSYGWPTPKVVSLDKQTRKAFLLELLKQQQ